MLRIILVLVVMVSACFLPVLKNGFVNWDDGNFMGQPQGHGLAPQHLRWMFTTFDFGNYYPLTWLTKGLDYTLWGTNPFGYHLTSLLLHLINTVLVFFLIRAVLARVPALVSFARSRAFEFYCAVGALFFAIHPLRVEPVAWFSARGDVVCCVFFISTILAFLQAVEQTGKVKAAWLALSLSLFVFSLLSRAWGITLPVALLVVSYYPLRRAADTPPWRRLGRLLLEVAPYIVLAAAGATVAFVARKAGLEAAAIQHGLFDRLMQSAFGLCFYLWKTILPTGLSPLYLLDSAFNPAEWKFIVCLLLALGITLALIAARRRAPWTLAAWLCYAVTVSPVLGLAQSGPQIAADRYTYLAGLPFAVLVGAGLIRLRLDDRLRLSGVVRRVLIAAALVWLGGLGVLTFFQTRVWRDTMTLWNHALRVDPRNSFAYNNRGHERKDAGDNAGALEDYSRAIQCNPLNASPYNNRGTLRGQLGQHAGALADLNLAIRLDPAYALAYNNRGVIRQAQGDWAGAFNDYDTALRLNPGLAEAYKNRGNTRQKLGDPAGALSDYAVALKLNPRLTEVHCARGVLFQSQGEPAAARREYAAAIEMNPGDADAYNNLGALCDKLGDADAAFSNFAAAIRLNPAHALAYFNRGNMRQRLGDLAGALADYAVVIRLDPGRADVFFARGIANGNLTNFAAAAADLAQALKLAPENWPSRAPAAGLLSNALERIATRPNLDSGTINP